MLYYIFFTVFSGVASAVPFYLIIFIISVFLYENNVSKEIIGLFSITSFPYSLKFLFSPIINKIQITIKIPLINKILCREKAFIILCQVIILMLIILLSIIDSSQYIIGIFIICTAIALFASLQDIALETYRIDNVPQKYKLICSTAASVGMHFGIYIINITCIAISQIFSWKYAFLSLSFFIIPGIISIIFIKNNHHNIIDNQILSIKGSFSHCRIFIKKQGITWILTIILAYKLSAMIFIKEMWIPFLLDMGYKKLQIITIDKSVSVLSCICGGILAGYISNKYNNIKQCLYFLSIVEIFTVSLLIYYAICPNNYILLITIIILKQFISGMNGAAFIMFLSTICKYPNTAIEYSILMSIASLFRIIISIMSGYVGYYCSWITFFIINAMFCIISSIYLVKFIKKNK